MNKKPTISTAKDGTPIIDTGTGTRLFFVEGPAFVGMWVAPSDHEDAREVERSSVSALLALKKKDIEALITALYLAKESWFK